MAEQEIFHQQFYSRYTLMSTVKNGGWKFIGMSCLTVIVILFYCDFYVSFSSFNRSNILLLVGAVGPLIVGVSFAIKEIKMENDVVFYRTVFPSSWKSFPLTEVHHVCYFQKPVERYGIFPKAVFFRNESERLALLELLIPKVDVYKLLSLVYDRGKPVLFFNEFKNIEETVYYVKSD